MRDTRAMAVRSTERTENVALMSPEGDPIEQLWTDRARAPRLTGRVIKVEPTKIGLIPHVTLVELIKLQDLYTAKFPEATPENYLYILPIGNIFKPTHFAERYDVHLFIGGKETRSIRVAQTHDELPQVVGELLFTLHGAEVLGDK